MHCLWSFLMLFLAIANINTTLAAILCKNGELRLYHRSSCRRFEACQFGEWQSFNCPDSEIFDEKLKQCTPGICRRRRQIQHYGGYSMAGRMPAPYNMIHSPMGAPNNQQFGPISSVRHNYQPIINDNGYESSRISKIGGSDLSLRSAGDYYSETLSSNYNQQFGPISSTRRNYQPMRNNDVYGSSRISKIGGSDPSGDFYLRQPETVSSTKYYQSSSTRNNKFITREPSFESRMYPGSSYPNVAPIYPVGSGGNYYSPDIPSYDRFPSETGYYPGSRNTQEDQVIGGGKHQTMEDGVLKILEHETRSQNGKVITKVRLTVGNRPPIEVTLDGHLPTENRNMMAWMEARNFSKQPIFTPKPPRFQPRNSTRIFPPQKDWPIEYLPKPIRPENPLEPGELPENVPKPIRPEEPLEPRELPEEPIKPPELSEEATDSPSERPTLPPKEEGPEILPEECGLSGKALRDKIVGGVETKIEDNPWQVAILEKDTLALSCGGSIISKRHVLTATHCFRAPKIINGTLVDKEIPKGDRLVLAGRTDIGENTELHEISQLYLHTKYENSHRRNDIAMIVIAGEFVFTPEVFPICVPTMKTAKYQYDRECKISGWGKTEVDANKVEKILRSAFIKLTTAEHCKKNNERFSKISEGMFCAGNFENGGIDSCSGDSGGPLSCKDKGLAYLYGITSFGVGCGEAKFPGVYAKVARYRKWIDNRLELSLSVRSRDKITSEEDEDIEDSPEEYNDDPEEDVV